MLKHALPTNFYSSHLQRSVSPPFVKRSDSKGRYLPNAAAQFRVSVGKKKGKKKKRRSDLISSVRPPVSAPPAVHASHQANHRGSSSWMVDRRDEGGLRDERRLEKSERPPDLIVQPARVREQRRGWTVNSSSFGDENVSVLRRHDF